MKLEVKYEGNTDLPGLLAQDEIGSYEVTTLSLMAPIYLQRWRYIGLMFSANNDDEFEMLSNSTFSVVLLGKLLILPISSLSCIGRVYWYLLTMPCTKFGTCF